MPLKVSFVMPNQLMLLMKIHFGNIKQTTEHPAVIHQYQHQS